MKIECYKCYSSYSEDQYERSEESVYVKCRICGEWIYVTRYATNKRKFSRLRLIETLPGLFDPEFPVVIFKKIPLPGSELPEQKEAKNPESPQKTSSSGVDLSFRPATYWPKSLNREQLLSRVKGKARRDTARFILEQGPGFTSLNQFVSREGLPDEQRQTWGMIHPQFMGGEYLPDFRKKEVEIARISLASVTADQFSVRASRTKSGIRYRIVDEYQSKFKQPITQSETPLSLGELITLIDKTKYVEYEYSDGLALSHLDYNYQACYNLEILESLEGFVSVESAFYPELGPYYDEMVKGWFEEHRREFTKSDDKDCEEEEQEEEEEEEEEEDQVD